MKPSTYQCIGHQRLASTGSSDAQTAQIPNGTSAIMVTVETNAARVTFTPAGDPTTNIGLIIQKDQNPWFLPIGQGAVFRVASTVASASAVQLAYLQ